MNSLKDSESFENKKNDEGNVIEDQGEVEENVDKEDLDESACDFVSLDGSEKDLNSFHQEDDLNISPLTKSKHELQQREEQIQREIESMREDSRHLRKLNEEAAHRSTSRLESKKDCSLEKIEGNEECVQMDEKDVSERNEDDSSYYDHNKGCLVAQSMPNPISQPNAFSSRIESINSPLQNQNNQLDPDEQNQQIHGFEHKQNFNKCGRLNLKNEFKTEIKSEISYENPLVSEITEDDTRDDAEDRNKLSERINTVTSPNITGIIEENKSLISKEEVSDTKINRNLFKPESEYQVEDEIASGYSPIVKANSVNGTGNTNSKKGKQTISHVKRPSEIACDWEKVNRILENNGFKRIESNGDLNANSDNLRADIVILVKALIQLDGLYSQNNKSLQENQLISQLETLQTRNAELENRHKRHEEFTEKMLRDFHNLDEAHSLLKKGTDLTIANYKENEEHNNTIIKNKEKTIEEMKSYIESLRNDSISSLRDKNVFSHTFGRAPISVNKSDEKTMKFIQMYEGELAKKEDRIKYFENELQKRDIQVKELEEQTRQKSFAISPTITGSKRDLEKKLIRKLRKYKKNNSELKKAYEESKYCKKEYQKKCAQISELVNIINILEKENNSLLEERIKIRKDMEKLPTFQEMRGLKFHLEKSEEEMYSLKKQNFKLENELMLLRNKTNTHLAGDAGERAVERSYYSTKSNLTQGTQGTQGSRYKKERKSSPISSPNIYSPPIKETMKGSNMNYRSLKQIPVYNSHQQISLPPSHHSSKKYQIPKTSQDHGLHHTQSFFN